MDRTIALLTSNPLWTFISPSFLRAFSIGDTLDWTWYSNAQAAGTQVYPQGLSKYFDMYSTSGWTEYVLYWSWAWFCFLLSPLTLFVPVNIWFSIINGESLENFWYALIPAPIVWWLHLRGENGWMLD